MEKSIMTKLESTRKWQSKVRAKGLCIRCGKVKTKKSYCKECGQKVQKCTEEWIARHREEHLEYLRQWRLKNPEYAKEYHRKHYVSRKKKESDQ